MEVIDFLQKSGKGEGERGKGFVFFPSPLTFSLFPPLAKVVFARGLFVTNELGFSMNEFPFIRNLTMLVNRCVCFWLAVVKFDLINTLGLKQFNHIRSMMGVHIQKPHLPG
ncbi:MULTISPECIES: hypothetical protein [unclassified Nostoc]|uniref:hypothetical protein n=1 Tax=unclassified Nostoc TaxID=2593658 RepID=UPI001684A12D|nr:MULTISPECIES: hypothetical protein [unclassified Nostoc]MBD2470385.1 hypothetical protein [Nostoc sp. FACHB-145]